MFTYKYLKQNPFALLFIELPYIQDDRGLLVTGLHVWNPWSTLLILYVGDGHENQHVVTRYTLSPCLSLCSKNSTGRVKAVISLNFGCLRPSFYTDTRESVFRTQPPQLVDKVLIGLFAVPSSLTVGVFCKVFSSRVTTSLPLPSLLTGPSQYISFFGINFPSQAYHHCQRGFLWLGLYTTV